MWRSSTSQHGKDIRIDIMIRNTIVALVLLLSAASVNAALIPINVEVTAYSGCLRLSGLWSRDV